MKRRTLLLAGAAALLPGAAAGQCITSLGDPNMPPCQGMISGGGPSLDLNFLAGTLPSGLTFTRSTVATYIDVAGAIQTAAINAPRFEYDPVTHALRGLLIEEQRTNLFLNSATLVTQNVTTTATPYTLSFYGTGTVTLTGTSIAGPLVGTDATTRVTQTFTPTAGTLTCTVIGSVTSAQIEAGAYATSYISTVGTTVARGADNCFMPITVGVAYTLAADFMPNAPTIIAANRAIVNVNDTTTANRAQIATSSATGLQSIFVGVASAGTQAATIASSTIAPLAVGKVAASFIAAGGLAACNGATPTAISAGALPVVTRLAIGNVAASSYQNGYFQRIRVWQRALPSAELIVVTT